MRSGVDVPAHHRTRAGRTLDAIDTHSSTIRFAATDGVELVGDLVVPVGLDDPPTAGVVVAHPHPQFGGDRFHPVVDAVARQAAAAGHAALRFDFRTQFDDGRGERLDVIAAAARLGVEVGDAPIVLAGYSFGAAMTLAATTGDDPVAAAALALVAPPFAMFGEPPPPGHDGPTLALVPERDQFGPPDAARDATADWPATSVDVVEGADHFLMGRAAEIAERVVAWVDQAVVSR